MNELRHALFIEIHVGEGREDRLNRERIDAGIRRPKLPRTMRVLADSLDRLNQQVLQRSGVLIFSAHANYRAPLPLRGLFTLIAEH